MLILWRAWLLPGLCGARLGCQRGARAAQPSGQQPLRRRAGTCGRSREGARRDKSLKGLGQTSGCWPPEPVAPPSVRPVLHALRSAGKPMRGEAGRPERLSLPHLIASCCLTEGLAHPAPRWTTCTTTASTAEVCTRFVEGCSEKQSAEVSRRLAAHLLQPVLTRWKIAQSTQKNGQNPLGQPAGQPREKHLNKIIRHEGYASTQSCANSARAVKICCGHR